MYHKQKKPGLKATTNHKQSLIDADSMESLRDAADTIYPDYVTLLSIRPYKEVVDLQEMLPWFDFQTNGSVVSYPKSRLIQPCETSRFFVLSLQSQYSLS